MTSAEETYIALRPQKPQGSLGRKAQDGHLDSHTAPELPVPNSPYGLCGREATLNSEGQVCGHSDLTDGSQRRVWSPVILVSCGRG